MTHTWVIVGATGTGKSAHSLELAERLRSESRAGEVVNADAMQLYRGMDIGTAKLKENERRGVPHHMFDVLDVTEEASVAWYQSAAREAISRIHERGNDAILVGGSGLYVSSVIFDFRFPPRDEALRAALEGELAQGGILPLLDRLRSLDPEAAESVDTKNPRRVVRALEVALLGGDAKTTLPSEPVLWLPDTTIYGVRAPREQLVRRLDERVDNMWTDGLVDEVRALVPQGIERGKTASQAIGYAQALAQLRGELEEPEAIAQTKALTRRYARRQVSWFGRYPGVTWRDAKVA